MRFGAMLLQTIEQSQEVVARDFLENLLELAIALEAAGFGVLSHFLVQVKSKRTKKLERKTNKLNKTIRV